MVNALDITQLIVAIPQAIEYTVKSIRIFRDYRKIDGNFRFSLEHAEDLVYCLRSYVIIIQCTALTEDLRGHLEKALRSAHRYMHKLSTTLDAWKERLQLRDCEDASVDVSEALEKSDILSVHDDSARSSLFLSRKSRGLHLCTFFRPVLLGVSKIHYLMLGALSIHDALHKLETVNNVLADFLPISQHLLHLLSYDEAVAEFTRRAKLRNEPRETLLPLSLPLTPIEETDDPIFFKVKEKGEYKGCIVERRMVHDLNRSGDEERAQVETERITRMLREEKQAADGVTTAEIGILRCCGYMMPNEDTHELIFRKPKGFTARTLRKILTTPGTEEHRIDDRIEFAIKLATAVHVFHSIGFVHKGIKPDAILVMEPMRHANAHFYDLGTPYLAGFNAARYYESASGMYSFDKAMNRKLYHDPRQLGNNRPQKYQMRDDIYSLGVCLLEIGLWRSVFRWDAEKKCYVVDGWAKDLFADVARKEDDEAEDQDEDEDEDETECDDNEFKVDAVRKEKLIQMARTLLPVKMNSVFCDVVVTCLTFGDSGSSLMEHKIGDYTGSARFYSEVICELRRAKVVQ